VGPFLASLAFAWLAAAQPASGDCSDGSPPSFPPEAVALQIDVGEAMGQPVECPHPDPVTRDMLQATTTGLFYMRAASRAPSFTDGQLHLALTPAGILAWTGTTNDPPQSADERIAPSRPTYQVISAGADPGPNASVAVEGDLDPARRSYLRVISIPPGTRVTVYAGEAREQLVTAPWAQQVALPDTSASSIHWAAQVFKEESHLPSIVAVQLIEMPPDTLQ
jgi:hypothetical protein